MTQHDKQYHGLDDEMPDDYMEWLGNLNSDQWLEFGEQYAKEMCKTTRKWKVYLEDADGDVITKIITAENVDEANEKGATFSNEIVKMSGNSTWAFRVDEVR